MAQSSSKITVLHTRIVSGTGGGPEKTIFNSPRHLAHTRYRELACYLHAVGDPGMPILAERAAEKGCPLITIADPHPFDLRTLEKLARLCRELEVKIWHGHDYKSNFFGVLLERICDLRLVTTVHGWVKHTARTPLYFAVDRWSLRRYEQVVAVSQDLYDAALACGVRRERLSLIENAIDTEEFRRKGPARLAARRAGSATPFVIGAVGRLSEEKGFHLLIEACERLADRGHAFELWIAGEGDQHERLARQIAAARHAPRWKLLGWQKDTLGLFEAFDLFALSSLREGLPNVVLEAMAMEVPVLATRCGGMSAFMHHGEDGWLVEPGSVDELEAGLERLLSDRALCTELASSARTRIEREFSFARRMEQMVLVYDRLWTR